jgi:uncharacterized membrane protein
VGTTAGLPIGLLGGAPGAALGATLGAATGLTTDAPMATVDTGFVESVKRDLLPGTTAIVVEANEGSMRAVDDLVALRRGHVYRQEAA